MRNEHRELIEKIVTASHILSKKGLVEGFGHVAARVPGKEDEFYITPRIALALVEPKDILRVNLDGELLEGDGIVPLELPMHTELFRRRPDVQAVARTHSEMAHIWSIVQEPIRPVHGFGCFLGKEVRTHPLPYLITTDELARKLIDTLGNDEAVLIRANGTLVVGGRVEEATMKAIYLEDSARLGYKARLLGTPTYFSEDEIKVRTDVRYDHFGRAWDYYANLL